MGRGGQHSMTRAMARLCQASRAVGRIEIWLMAARRGVA